MRHRISGGVLISGRALWWIRRAGAPRIGHDTRCRCTQTAVPESKELMKINPGKAGHAGAGARLRRPLWIYRYGAALALVALALAIALLLQGALGLNPFLLFVAAVAVSAWYGGIGAGLLATLCGLFLSDYFFLPPYRTFAVSLDDLILLVIFGLVAILISTLTESRHRAEQRLEVILASIGDAVIVTDAHGRVTFMNRVAATLTGWSQIQARGQHLDQVFPIIQADSRQPVESPVTKVLREGRVVGLANHTLLIARDGTERPIDDSGAPVRTLAGKLDGVVLIFRDISERYEAEQAMRESEQRFRIVADTAPVMIWMTDTDGHYTFFNQPWLSFTGRTLVQELGDGWMAGIHPDDRSAYAAIARAAIAARQPFTLDYRLRRADGVKGW